MWKLWNFTLTIFLQKFREINACSTRFECMLCSRNISTGRVNFLFFHSVCSLKTTKLHFLIFQQRMFYHYITFLKISSTFLNVYFHQIKKFKRNCLIIIYPLFPHFLKSFFFVINVSI